VTVDVLSNRQLNRATLERQLLLERADRSVGDAVHHLVGLQAQEPLDPYYALWSRLAGFRPGHLIEPFVGRELVRCVAIRGTIHLLTGDDCLGLRHLVQPVLDEELTRHSEHRHKLRDLDLGPVLAVARPLLAEPRSLKQLKDALAAAFPDLDAPALAYACRNHLVLVQVPPRGVWGSTLQVTYAEAQAWLGRPLDTSASVDDLVLRYLAAFGPAATPDIATWSRLKRMREVVDRLRPRLRIYRDERGRELFDLPDRTLPDPDVRAPVRFLPEYDNLLLSHDDRSRVVDRAETAALFAVHEGRRHHPGSVLVDGRVRATWVIDRDPTARTATLHVDHLGSMTPAEAAAVEAEGMALLRFATDDATDVDGLDIRFRELA
jgi:Winged helix DNA-binding domain